MRLLRNFFTLIGIFFFICLVFSFTEQPYWGYHWLGTSKSELKWEPKHIILLGGGGMPSQSNLMRSWYTEKAAKSFPQAKVIVAMPGLISDSLSTPQRMKAELVLRGISAESISFESKGTNTRSQALECQGLIKMQDPILLVTSPEHMRRAVLCFKKAGFEKVNALPAFENAAEADFSFTDDELGGNKTLVPDVGNNINMRYQVWNHLKYEILIAREMFALSYYKLRGWI
ncbi:YdcF family protein [Draconibacterium sp. IB214405]|uniref:YdcF family protein n=1 Tax=Draconibacterium sp. IB214405 TaxID=3097352 RepID=UPI002A15373C|nr:YdcF family protein [Draconibacterium sp. IB214405]MDX8339913.1 YdcF family protein [Draconibacterium sp. IB214405]